MTKNLPATRDKKQTMSAYDYEQVVHDLTKGLCESLKSGDLLSLQISYGRTNRIKGASSFLHQIDVSLVDDKRMFLIECKCKLLSARKVDASDVLAFAARKIDIRECHPSLKVYAILVSLEVPTMPAKVLAKHFGIEIEVVKSVRSYGMRLGKYAFNGISESARATDRVFDTVIRQASQSTKSG